MMPKHAPRPSKGKHPQLHVAPRHEILRPPDHRDGEHRRTSYQRTAYRCQHTKAWAQVFHHHTMDRATETRHSVMIGMTSLLDIRMAASFGWRTATTYVYTVIQEKAPTMDAAPKHNPTQTHDGARATAFAACSEPNTQAHSTHSKPTRVTSTLALLIALTLTFPVSTTKATAQTAGTPETESTHTEENASTLPQLSDFTPPYTCPLFFGRPASCNIPIKVSLECVDIRTIPANRLSRPFTEEELSNADQACKLLPLWIDQDPRIVVVDKEKSKLHLKYRLTPVENEFIALRIYTQNKSFQIMKGKDEEIKYKASYFVQKSLFEIEKRGHLP